MFLFRLSILRPGSFKNHDSDDDDESVLDHLMSDDDADSTD